MLDTQYNVFPNGIGGRAVLTALSLAVYAVVLAEPSTGLGQDRKINNIQIATPQWDGQTNKDGTGLFFEIVKRIYEPEEIKVDVVFCPWKRAQSRVSSGKSDAMLCVWREHAAQQKQLIPQYCSNAAGG